MALDLLDRRLQGHTWCKKVQDIGEYYECDSQGLLGKGTYAEVVPYYRKSNKARCAVKIFMKRSVAGSDLTKVKQLLVEIAATKQLEHPSLVKTAEVLHTDTHIYLIMDRCQGVTLTELLQRYTKLREKDSAIVLSQVLSGLQCLHSYHLVHRDVKPDNIMVEPLTLVTCLIDLGLGKFVGGRNAFPQADALLFSPLEAELPFPNNSMDRCLMTPEAGTALYLAIEGLAGKLEADETDAPGWVSKGKQLYKLDIYAAGATVFKMLTGRLPYDTGKQRLSLSQRRNLMKLHPAKLPTDGTVSKDAILLVESMLSNTPEDRPTASAALSSRWITTASNEQGSLSDQCMCPESEPHDESSWDDMMSIVKDAEECD